MPRTLRWLVFLVLLLVPAWGLHGETVAGLPAPAGYVNDFAGVLTPGTVQSLDDLCAQLDHEAHAQIAVVTVKTVDPDKSGATPSIEEFATALEDKWKVGAKGTDRGVLLIFVMNPLPPHGRIEVGYGLEGLLNDAKVGDIGRAMKPILVNGDYDQAVTLGVREIAQDIAADSGVTLNLNGAPPAAVPQYASGGSQQQGQISILPVILFGIVIVVVLGALIRSGHAGLLFFILFNMLSGGRGGGGGFEGGCGGGGGGGFGGFGGGGSGGGGADF
jgi:uncharacterized protein